MVQFSRQSAINNKVKVRVFIFPVNEMIACIHSVAEIQTRLLWNVVTEQLQSDIETIETAQLALKLTSLGPLPS